MEEAIPLVVISRALHRKIIGLARRAAHSSKLQRGYAIGGFLVLIATTVLWATLGARLQGHNADQLSDPYLFTNGQTFHGAAFPGTHTFLLKWPIFWLVATIGISAHSLVVATVVIVLATVLALVALLYRVNRRPLVFGTMCLSLSLALLLVPAQPYSGGILPVNMAMLTTRNIEYVIYIAALILLVRARRMRTLAYGGGVALLTLLIASDKLFLSLSGLGALLALIVYALASNWSLAAFAARWVAATVFAAAGSVIILACISSLHLTHFVNDTAANPYGFALGARGLGLGALYALMGLFTNFGANPAYDNRLVAQLPQDMLHGFWSWRGPAYLVAFIGFVYLVRIAWPLFRVSLKAAPRRAQPLTAPLLALTLVWSSIAAVGVFVVTNHYYPVDARYLAVVLFALVLAASVTLRERRLQWSESAIYGIGVLVAALCIGIFVSYHTYTQQNKAFTGVEARNNLVLEAVHRHKVDTLVGDYWRVLPIKEAAHESINVTPLSGCTQPTGALTSKAWQPDLAKHSFAYLLTLDSDLTNFPHCTLAQVTVQYGRPLSTQVIAGSLANPKEVLLFYDLGAHHPTADLRNVPLSLEPIALASLPNTGCDEPTIVNVVAHQDDDLLFLSPDLAHDLQSGRCVRTIYLTAGDGGSGKLYWISRQLGAEAAYSNLLGLKKNVWEQQIVRVSLGEYITVARPQGNTKVSLIFMNLPDGNLRGDGFPASGNESLAKLRAGEIGSMQTVDKQSSYTAIQLVSVLSQLMSTFQAAAIHTQGDVPSTQYPDHSDHMATGQFAQEAAMQYDTQRFGNGIKIPIIRYIGYPIHGYAANISGDDLVEKEAAFLAYAQYDGGVCRTVIQCSSMPTYGNYLTRQYTEDPAHP